MRKLALLVAALVLSTMWHGSATGQPLGSTSGPTQASPDIPTTTAGCMDGPVVRPNFPCLGGTTGGTPLTTSGSPVIQVSTGSKSSSSSSNQSTTRYYSYDRVTTGPDGQPCVTTGYAAEGTQANDATTLDPAGQQILDAHNLAPLEYPPCPPQPRAQGEPQSVETPSMVARRFWELVNLPVPGPQIAPGRAITGKAAFLETNGKVSHTYSYNTPLGPLTIYAAGQYSVAWGDGTHSGPYSFEGTAWPHGRITHEYQQVGTYDVVLTEQWTATWQLAGESGVLRRLATVGRIEDFQVEQIQAVIGR